MKNLRRRVEKFNGLSVGLDLHKKFIQVGVLERHGDEIKAERMAADQASLVKLIDRLLALPQAGKGLSKRGGESRPEQAVTIEVKPSDSRRTPMEPSFGSSHHHRFL